MQESFKHQLDTVVHSMCYDMIGLPVSWLDVQEIAESEFEYGGVVHLVGAGFRSVVVHCDKAFGEKVAAKMFDAAPEALQREQVDDTLRELANMIGGNIKSLASDSQVLSPPKTIHQVGTHSGVQEGSIICRRYYSTPDHDRMCVSIYDCKIDMP